MKSNKWVKLIYLGIFLIILAFGFVLYNYYVDVNAGKVSKGIVEKIKEKTDEENGSDFNILIDNEEYIGIISIPSLNIELPVANNWSYSKMKISPCRYYGSLDTNDLVICAHSYKHFFRYIRDLVSGDIVYISDLKGNKYTFEVKLVEVLGPEDINEMIESDFDLTLFTCTSDSQNRVTVRLDRID